MNRAQQVFEAMNRAVAAGGEGTVEFAALVEAVNGCECSSAPYVCPKCGSVPLAIAEKDKLIGKLAALLQLALEKFEEDVNNRDGIDNHEFTCGACEARLAVPHSFGCKARAAVAEAMR